MISFKAIGTLLDYPTIELQAAADEIEQALGEERALPPAELEGLRAFIDRLRASDASDLIFHLPFIARPCGGWL